jgi:hypothetical protein
LFVCQCERRNYTVSRAECDRLGVLIEAWSIILAIRNHTPAEKVRGISRHASLDMLMIYYHETDRIDDPAEKYISY